MAKLNPVFTGINADEGIETAQASIRGVGLKTAILLAVAILSGLLTITFGNVLVSSIAFWVIVMLGALIGGIVGQMSVKAAPVCSFVYAICEGAILGVLSFCFEVEIKGIVLTAVLVTATIFGTMLLLYSTKVIKVTSNFIRTMSAIGLTIFVVSLVYGISYLINPQNALILALTSNPLVLILVCVGILLYGAFMLTLDFEQVNTLVSGGFDTKYEWTAALGLMVTIVWIYVEVLRILAIIMRNKK